MTIKLQLKRILGFVLMLTVYPLMIILLYQLPTLKVETAALFIIVMILLISSHLLMKLSTKLTGLKQYDAKDLFNR